MHWIEGSGSSIAAIVRRGGGYPVSGIQRYWISEYKCKLMLITTSGNRLNFNSLPSQRVEWIETVSETINTETTCRSHKLAS